MISRAFRFGVTGAQAQSRGDWIARARAASSLGYSSLYVPDHIGNQLGPIAALACIAENTDLKIGTQVLANDFRHPVMLAKELATLDLLSEGRLEIGVGAGWLHDDYAALGITLDRPGTRIARLEESVIVLKGLFDGGPFTFNGDYYTIGPLQGAPKPYQRPHPALLIGGGGPKILQLAARHAQIIGINPNLGAGTKDPARLGPTRHACAFAASVDIVRMAAGERLAGIELNIAVIDAQVTNNRRAAARQIGQRIGLDEDAVLSAPQVLVGTVEQICHDLAQRRERFGISYVTVGDRGWPALAEVVGRMAGT